MTRKEHLAFCQICKNREMNMQQGLICKLTGTIANFETNCPEYLVDDDEKKKYDEKQVIQTIEQKEESEQSKNWILPLLIVIGNSIRIAMSSGGYSIYTTVSIISVIISLIWFFSVAYHSIRRD